MSEFPNKDVTYFAEADFRNKGVRFGIKSLDRTRHFYVIGKTGFGKSTLLENMTIQDIDNNNGVGYMDPHGKSAELFLDYIPKERIKDVIYFAPHDMEYPFAFNVMEDVGKDQRHLVANGLMAAFKKIWPDVWSARMEYISTNIILALLEYPDSTMLGVNRMLSDKAYRNKVVAYITDPSVKSFWVDEYAKYGEKLMAEASASIQNKFGQFISNPLIRNILGQPKSTFNLRDVMDGKKILIMNLSKGQMGEINANLIGGMLITKIYLAAMSRAGDSAEAQDKLPPFYFFVDEFQSFVNESFKDILSEARKYKLALTIAHQYIEQVPEEVRNAVFGNVGTLVTFRVGPLDAEMFEKVFTPKFLAADLVNLGFAQIYLTLMIDGVGSQPFSAKTMGPIKKPDVSYRQEVIDHSRKTYAKPRAEVEADIAKWYASGTEDVPAALAKFVPLGRSDNQSAKPAFSQDKRPTSSSSIGGVRPIPPPIPRPLMSRPPAPTLNSTRGGPPSSPRAGGFPARSGSPSLGGRTSNGRFDLQVPVAPKMSLSELQGNKPIQPVEKFTGRNVPDLKKAIEEAMRNNKPSQVAHGVSLSNQPKVEAKIGEAMRAKAPESMESATQISSVAKEENKPIDFAEAKSVKEVPEEVLRKILGSDDIGK
ncbi:MAG: type IV secretion system DNA-binding domain-containing protein [Candidatus Vogelbacteria bacterium]|nr:type IV secretion system DNA-binding domain-containing protein [Candidatus Vogelbacteria bacterium]